MSTSELRRQWARPRTDRSDLRERFRDLRQADYRVRRRLSIGQVFMATGPDLDLRKIRSGRPVIWARPPRRSVIAPACRPFPQRRRAFGAVELCCYATRSGKARMTAAVRLETPSRR